MSPTTLTQEQKDQAITVNGTIDALNFKTQMIPLYDGLGHEIKDFRGVLRTDTGRVLAVMSDKYKLVEHREAMEPAIDALGSDGWKIKASRIEGGGARAYVELLRKDASIRVVGEQVGERILMRNTYDGSSSLTLMIGALVLACTNGAVVPGKGSIGFHQHHMGDIREQFGFLTNRVRKIEAGLGARMIEAYSQLDKVVPNEIGKEIVRRVMGERKMEKPLGYWRHGIGRDGSATAWNLYNGVTQYLTHDFTGTWSLRERKNADAFDLIAGWIKTGALPKVENQDDN